MRFISLIGVVLLRSSCVFCSSIGTGGSNNAGLLSPIEKFESWVESMFSSLKDELSRKTMGDSTGVNSNFWPVYQDGHFTEESLAIWEHWSLGVEEGKDESFLKMEGLFQRLDELKKLDNDSIEHFSGLCADIENLRGLQCAKKVAESAYVPIEWFDKEKEYFITPWHAISRAFDTDGSTQLPFQLEQLSELFYAQYMESADKGRFAGSCHLFHLAKMAENCFAPHN